MASTSATAKRKRVQYSPTKMTMAIEMVKSGAMSKKKASITYGVPRTTLLDKLSGRSPEQVVRPGPSTVLTAAEENVLVDYLKLMSSIGYPLQRQELLVEVKKVLDHDGRSTPFNGNLPGKDWYYAFKRRHPDLSERKPMSLGHQRALINVSMIQTWFDSLFGFLKAEVSDWEELVKDPRRLFNADESGFPLSVTSGRVLAPTGARHVYQVVTGNKTQITVMASFNAMGQYVPPLIVYPGERFRDTGISGFPEAIYGHSQNGWMDSDLFVSFLGHLHDYVKEQKIPLPIILFVDGHSTHMSLEAARFCNDNNIVLYCLLPNATHILQPCDIGLFSPMKSAWKKDVKQWQIEHIGESLSKRVFPEVFKKTWTAVAKFENAANGFKRCGLFPLSPSGIDQSKLAPSEIANPTSLSTAAPANADTQDASPLNDTLPPENSPQQLDTTPSANDPIDQLSTLPLQPIPVTSNIQPSTSANAPPVNLVMPARFDKNNVSASFNLLTVPEPKKKRENKTIRGKLPKAISGQVALKLLEEREAQKIAEANAKLKRKEERQQKKKEKEEILEKKRLEREEKKRMREQKKKDKQNGSRNKKQKKSDPEMSSSDEENCVVEYAESDDSYEEGRLCPGCKSDDGAPDEWVNCRKCPLSWHITCTGDAILLEIPESQIKNYPFYCEYCM